MTVWQGWGTSLCWWANIDYPIVIKEQLIELLFGDLGLNIARYNLGGGYNKNLKQNMRQGSLTGCLINEKGVFDTDFDKLQIDILRRAVSKNNSLKIEVFSNSPPYYMTKSGYTNGSNISFDCNLRPECTNNFVDFLLNCYTNLKEEFQGIISLSPFNEPSNPFWTTQVNQEGCYFDFGTRTKILQKLNKKSNQKNYVLLAGAEEFSSGFGLFWQMFNWNKYIDRINIHGYHLKWNDFTFYFDDYDFIRRIFRFFTSKDIWMSEFGWGYPDNVKDTLPLARQIFRDLDTFKPSAWIYWQAVENTIGNWGLIQIDFNNPNKILIKKQFYIFKHFTQFLKENDTYSLTHKVDFFSKKCILKINDGKKLIILNDTSNPMLVSDLPTMCKKIIQTNENDTYLELNKIPKVFPRYSITSIIL
jgi:hypothetical protein